MTSVNEGADVYYIEQKILNMTATSVQLGKNPIPFPAKMLELKGNRAKIKILETGAIIECEFDPQGLGQPNTCSPLQTLMTNRFAGRLV